MLIADESPVGPIGADWDGSAISAVFWGRAGNLREGAVYDAARAELAAYFAGTLATFTVPLSIRGTSFQVAFLKALCAIPLGETRTYGDLARELGVSAQAIGQACGANPIPIFIPCHRVLGADGLGGYSGRGGVETKITLLKHEGAGSLLI